VAIPWVVALGFLLIMTSRVGSAGGAAPPARPTSPRHPDELWRSRRLTAALMTDAHIAALAIATRLNRGTCRGASSEARLGEIVADVAKGQLVTLSQCRRKTIPEVELGRMALALAKTLEDAESALCQIPIHRHHIRIN
jgi:hypothetical protein